MIINDANIFITGGTGSFGTAYIKHLLSEFSPRKIIVYSRDELKQYEQELDLDDARVEYVIGDIRNRERLVAAMVDVDFVVHAAAMKQVVAAERNPSECIEINILGTENVIEAALANNVKRLIALSTDKAVNPVNLYGATKLCADKLVVNANRRSGKTKFSVVRYGNVVGSRGSVVPFFQKVRPTGRIPITDIEMTRFWITLDQAVAFVTRCLNMMGGAEVFISKIPSMKITDLANAIAPECEQEVIGIRPGEKLHEVMVPSEESRRTLEFASFYVITPDDGSVLNAEEFNYAEEVGKPVSANFRYASDSNPDWVGIEDLSKLIPVSKA